MSIIQITIISLIIIGATACILALIWTKIIRPNDFAYSYKNRQFKTQYDELIKHLNSQSKVSTFNNILLNFDQTKAIIIERMFVTVQNVYLVANPLSKKVLDVKLEQEKIRLCYLKKTFNLPLDLNLLISTKKQLSHYSKVPITLIVPVLNPDFATKEVQQMHFVALEQMETLINKLEMQTNEFNSKEFVSLIEKYLIRRRPPRSLKFWKKADQI